MVTPQQFDSALQVILAYKAQLENQVYKKEVQVGTLIDIQKNITSNTFWVLQNYFHDYHQIDLEWEDFKAFRLEYLMMLNFEKLRLYRGFGKKSEQKLLEILKPHISSY